jgi:hypothetical protein
LSSPHDNERERDVIADVGVQSLDRANLCCSPNSREDVVENKPVAPYLLKSPAARENGDLIARSL